MRALQSGNTVCIPWGRGGGKSWFQRLKWYHLVGQWDGRRRPGAPTNGVRIALLMPTLEQAKKVHATLMLGEVSPGGPWGFLGGRVNRTEWRVEFPGGSWIQWVTAERAKNIRGLRCDFLSVDECDDIDIEVYDAITVPWFSEPHSLRMSLLSGTPTRGRYGLLYRSHARGAGKLLDPDGKPFADHASFHATCYDFPEYVSAAAIAKAKRETPAALFKREWECDFDAAEGLVYPHFSEAFHVREPHPDTKWSEIIVGADWGFEDPAALLAFGVVGGGNDAAVHLLDEVYVQHKNDSDLAKRAAAIKAKWPSARWFADPSRPQTIELFRREAGVNIVGAKNDIEDGVAMVGNFLLVREKSDGERYARFYVSARCTNTIRELGLYRRRRDPRNRERVLDAIEDKNNHAMDAARYAIYSRFGGERPPPREFASPPAFSF